MDYEKIHNESLEMAKRLLNEGKISQECAEMMFPELAELEDERIRKGLINLIYKVYANTPYITCVEHENMLAWLEKQGEQKPAWSEEDKNVWLDIKSLIDSLLSDGGNSDYTTHELQKMWDWLDTIWQKDRVQPQPKQEWSKEDDEMLTSIAENCPEKVYLWAKALRPHKISVDEAIRVLEEAADGIEIPDKYGNPNWLKDRLLPQPKQEWSDEDKKHYNMCLQYFATIKEDSIFYEDYLWLKSLRPQKQWKPTENHLKGLRRGIKNTEEGSDAWYDLKDLYEQLKEL